MTLRRYERYKDSGVEWLGGVPAHWEVQPIKRLLLSVEQGWSPQCENFPAESGQWGVLKVGCVNGGRFNADENKALPADLEPLPELGIRRGDVLVSRANTRELVGSVAVADRDYAHLLLCDKLYRLRVMPDRCEPLFLAHFIGSAAARSVIEAAATGASSSMLNIAQSAVVGMSMALPAVDEQRALLRFLDAETAKIDTLITEQQRLIELLTEKRQAIIAHAVTKGLNPLAQMKDSGVEWIGDVPAHWRVSALGYVASIETGSTPDRGNSEFWEGDIPWIKTGEINYQPIRTAEEYITELGLSNSAAKIAPPGTLLMAMYGQGVTRGRVAVLEIACAYNQACAAISFGTSVDVRFARYFFIAAYEHVRDAGNETSQMNLSAGIIRKFKLTVPPISDQKEIIAFLDDESSRIDRLFREAEQATALLRERRTALISAAVTGQIDVRDSAPVESTLAETHGDVAAGRYVVESASAHVARVQAMAAAEAHPSAPPRSVLS